MDSGTRKEMMMSVLKGCEVRTPHKQVGKPKAFVSFKNNDKHVTGAIYSQCKKKAGYSTRRMAERVVERIKAERGDQLRYYLCEHCGKYHLSKHFRDNNE